MMPETAIPPSAVAVWSLVVVQVFTFLTVACNYFFQSRKTRKRDEAELARRLLQRQWAVEDRTALEQQSHNHKIALASQIQETKEVAVKANEALSKKADHIVELTNGNMSALREQLTTANARIEGLEKLVTRLMDREHPKI